MTTTVTKVSVEVRSATARFRVRIQAPSVRRAIELAAALRSSKGVAVLFPIDQVGSLVEDPIGVGGSLIEADEARERAA